MDKPNYIEHKCDMPDYFLVRHWNNCRLLSLYIAFKTITRTWKKNKEMEKNNLLFNQNIVLKKSCYATKIIYMFYQRLWTLTDQHGRSYRFRHPF